MDMAGVGDETAFNAVMAKVDVMQLIPKLRMPHFIMAGEDDSVSDFACTIEHHSAPWGDRRTYEYGAPLGVNQLLSNTPPMGLS